MDHAARPRLIARYLLSGLLTLVGVAQELSQPPSLPGSAPTTTIPDGTKIRLRFAQGLYSPFYGAGFWVKRISIPNALPAQEGAKVRLVVSEDIRIGGQVVITRGAPAEATIVGVAMRQMKDWGTGITLQLDWVQDITGQNLLIRHSPQGKPDWGLFDITARKGGVEATPITLKSTLKDSFSVGFLAGLPMVRRKFWIPTGTRITAYTHGNVEIDMEELRSSQSRLPARSTDALVTFYRLKGPDEAIELICDERSVAKLEENKYLVLELVPGKHSCKIGSAKATEFSLEGGEEYYFQLDSSLLGGWDVKPVSREQGEDEIVRTDPIGP